MITLEFRALSTADRAGKEIYTIGKPPSSICHFQMYGLSPVWNDVKSKVGSESLVKGSS